jgi:hypothetical protein
MIFKPLYLAALLGLTFTLNSFTDQKSNELSAQEKREGWNLLFDGKTTDGWHVYNKGKIQTAWTVQHGELHCKPDDYTAQRGDLVSDKQYENYDLKFDWKIAKAGNSGVFINVQERKDIPTAWSSGPEYQLLEKSHHDHDANPAKRAGCMYNLYPQKNSVPPKAPGQWNQSRIKQVNGKIEFYLNGVLTAQEDLKSEKWKKTVAASNFKTFPEFGKHTKGHLALQDWAKGISFRNIKLRQL